MVALNEIHSFQIKKSYVKYAILAFFAVNIVFSSFTQALATYEFIDNKPTQLQEVTLFLSKKYEGRMIILIDCFWGTSLYPFGTYLNVIDNTYTGYNFTVKYYSQQINDTGLAVIGPLGSELTSVRIRNSLFNLYASNIILSNLYYTVIDLNHVSPLI